MLFGFTLSDDKMADDSKDETGMKIPIKMNIERPTLKLE